MAGMKFSLRLCPKTEAVLATVPLDRRSAYVREAILFYHDQGTMLRRIEEKLDLVMETLGERLAGPRRQARAQDTRDTTAMETYLFSGQDDIFNV